MERLKNIIRRLGLTDNETIINKERLKNLEDTERIYTKLKGLPIEQRIKEIQQQPVKTQTHNGGGAKKKPPLRVLKIISGKSRDTTGLIRKTTHGYDYYYYNIKIAKRPFRATRNSVEELLEIQKEWNQCDIKDVKHWKKIISYDKPVKGVYKKTKNSYQISYKDITYGSVSTEAKGYEIVDYLKYKNWDVRFKSVNLSSSNKLSREWFF